MSSREVELEASCDEAKNDKENCVLLRDHSGGVCVLSKAVVSTTMGTERWWGVMIKTGG